MIRLGDIAKDNITGYKGTVVAVTEWLHGCRRLTMQAADLKDGKPIDTCTFDEPQCSLVKAGVHASSSRTGGPRPEPEVKRSPR